MEKKRFKLINNVVAAVIFAISAFVYLSTIEPTASFWDCGEFIASSYKLEVGHPPGNPVFNLFARFFTMFTDNMHAAAAVNAMSALCSALTIFFLYLTIVHFGRRLLEKRGREMTTGTAVGLFCAGAVGALAYCFSDTFWFSAVEGEVYAMSSLFTAVVFWAILKWEEEAGQPYADRWIVLISFLMGLSIGVHLLNLLTIPAIVFIVYFKRKEGKVTFWQGLGVLLLSGVILAVILFGIIPYLPKIAAFFDRIFVNGLGAGFNVGAAVFMILLLAGCFIGLKVLRAKEKPVWHTGLLCFTTIIIGYSLFAITIIRSCANTPTNEYQPDNPYTLVRYLSREQYGSAPLIYGETYASPYEIKTKEYWTPLDERYYKAENVVPDYPAGAKMFFPRMWNSFDERHKAFYEDYTHGKNRKIINLYGERRAIMMPKFSDNLVFFFDFQVNYMYFRYFFWNFVGRQNDFHGQTPGDKVSGNWESGITFLDKARLGDQSKAPDILAHNKAKNHYFFLPLILGLIGFFFQTVRDGRNGWVTFLLFILTGLAIVVYLNQPPFQVRERDYAYAGSFYVFAIWIGLGVMKIQEWLEKPLKKDSVVAAGVAGALCLCVPLLMGCQNWDDHDRSHRTTAVDMAYNHLAALGPNAIIITHGDNDTFPLWYLQEVEEARLDVRIVNTSLLGTDWYIDQMKRKQYDSDPLPITIDRIQYLYGTNDFPRVEERLNRPILASEAIDIFRNPNIRMSDGKTDYIPAKKLLVPVNKENVRKYGIVPEKDMDKVADFVELEINADRIGKCDLIILDILAHYNWDRPIYYVTENADVSLGLEKWSERGAFCYKFVPIYSETPREKIYTDPDKLYDDLMHTFRFESLKQDNVYYDYQNIYTFEAVVPIRDMFVSTARIFIERGDTQKAIDLLDRCIDIMPEKNFPYNIAWMRSLNEISLVRMVDAYFQCGEDEKAVNLAKKLGDAFSQGIAYFSNPGGKVINQKFVDDQVSLFYYLIDILERNDSKDMAELLQKELYMTMQGE
jgi:hypothetical protein